MSYSAIYKLPLLLTYMTSENSVSNIENICYTSKGWHNIFNDYVVNGRYFYSLNKYSMYKYTHGIQ